MAGAASSLGSQSETAACFPTARVTLILEDGGQTHRTPKMFYGRRQVKQYPNIFDIQSRAEFGIIPQVVAMAMTYSVG